MFLCYIIYLVPVFSRCFQSDVTYLVIPLLAKYVKTTFTYAAVRRQSATPCSSMTSRTASSRHWFSCSPLHNNHAMLLFVYIKIGNNVADFLHLRWPYLVGLDEHRCVFHTFRTEYFPVTIHGFCFARCFGIVVRKLHRRPTICTLDLAD